MDPSEKPAEAGTASSADGQGDAGVRAEGDSARGDQRLDVILRSLPASELAGLIKRIGIKVDDQKRIDVASQAARALVGLPEVRDPSRLPTQSYDLLHRVAEAGGLLAVPSLPAGIDVLMSRGILFARRAEQGIELVLPIAYLVQLPSWQSEDPRSLRALIAQAPFETVNAISSHYLGRPATPPLALALEAAWEVVSDRRALALEIDRLPMVERRLLESIEAGGGEVETPELLDLEREPLRVRGAKGVSSSRRGAGFALERRALLIPIHPNRHVVPSEVAEIVGAERKRAFERHRSTIRAAVVSEDYVPRRARFARDPAPLIVALAIAARESAQELRPNIGTPRSLIVRLAQRFGRSTGAVSMFAALSRAIGMWEPTAASSAAPPGNLRMGEIGATYVATWRRGGAWDEARPEPEVMRAAADQRDASPSRMLREIVIDALVDVGEDAWVSWKALGDYVARDPRIEGAERLLRRWAERVNLTPPNPVDVCRRIALDSLPNLGVVDLGADADAMLERVGGSQLSFDSSEIDNLMLRVSARGRAWLHVSGSKEPAWTTSEFRDASVLTVGSGALVANLLAVGVLAEFGRVDDALEFVFSQQAIARAVAAGALADEVRARIESVATIPSSLSQILVSASAVIGKGTFVPTAGFLWIEDPEVRELLRTRKQTADLFVDPSPPSGLLLAPDVDLDRVVRRARGLGVELEGVPALARIPTPAPIENKSGARARTSASAAPVVSPRTRTPFPRTKG
ncbi:MAG: hypothetical protein U0414_28085 [Polyangiaceae bacterium]